MVPSAVFLFGASWLLILTVLVLDLTGRRPRGAYFRWQGSGLLLIWSVLLLNSLAELRRWPESQLHLFRAIVFPFALPGFALILIGGAVAHSRGRRNSGRI